MKLPFDFFRGLIIGALTVGLITAALSLAHMRTQILSIGNGSATGPVWYVTGVERELQEFEFALAYYELDPTTANNVTLRFDILWSMVASISQGDVAAKLEDFNVDYALLEQMPELLKKHDAAIMEIGALTREERMDILLEFRALNDEVHQVGMKALQASSAETLTWRETLLSVSNNNAVVGIILIVIVTILILMFQFDRVAARRQLREKDALLVAAEAASVAKSQFISVINHELRTPLTSIKGAISLMSAGALGEVPKTFERPINIAERNCRQLSSLISDLLDAEKFSSGAMEYKFEPINLPQFLTEQIETHASFADSYGVTLSIQPSVPELIVNGDAHRLGQVMSNLLSNAVKFSKSGDHVTVSLEEQNGRAVVSVTDTGRGIPEAARDKVFERFQQVDSSNERERGGTGLGLSIVKAIVEAHGGHVDFDSVVGEGTTFKFDLSLVK